jgi:hypothetical protein
VFATQLLEEKLCFTGVHGLSTIIWLIQFDTIQFAGIEHKRQMTVLIQ